MGQTSVGIRELKSRLSSYLRQVKDGATLVITERGTPVGRIVPIRSSVEERTEDLAQAGLISWSGRRLASRQPLVVARGKKTVSDLLLEDRE
jgi:prevent-host-death family protein